MAKTQKGMFITLEGGEAVGKTAQMLVVMDTLHALGKNAVRTREPGGTVLAEKIRSLPLEEHEEDIDPETELMLFFASRRQHLINLIEPALAAGKWVVCDRFTDSTFAYQCRGGQIDDGRFAGLERWCLDGHAKPDLTLLLDAPAGEVMGRRYGTVLDRIEKKAGDYFERVRGGYLERAEADPERFRIIDATLPLETVSEHVTRHVREFAARAM